MSKTYIFDEASMPYIIPIGARVRIVKSDGSMIDHVGQEYTVIGYDTRPEKPVTLITQLLLEHVDPNAFFRWPRRHPWFVERIKTEQDGQP